MDELARRKRLAQQMGGPEGIARQRARGKLTVRERIDALADPDTFREFMGLTGDAHYTADELTGFTPKPAVEGTCLLDGRKVIVTAGDFTVRGGSAGTRGGLGQEPASNVRAREWRIPYVRLLDAAGGSVRSFEDDRPHLSARRQRLERDRRRIAELRARGLGRDGLGCGTARDQRMPCALQPDGEGQEPAVSRRTAGRQSRPRLRHHEGRSRRRSHSREDQRQRRQPRRRRSPRVRADAAVPVVSAEQRLGNAAARRHVRRSAIDAKSGCCR